MPTLKVADNKSNVHLLISKGYDNFISSGTDEAMVGKVKDFLNSLQADVDAGNRVLDYEIQQKVIKEAEKALSKEADTGKDLSKDLEKLTAKISDNKQAQALKQKMLEDEKTRLQGMKK